MTDSLPKEKKVVEFPACRNFYHTYVSDGTRVFCKHCKRPTRQPKAKQS